MRYKWGWLGVVVWVTAVLLLAACQSESEGGRPPSPTVTPEPTREKLDYIGPKPDNGLGNVYGKISWNEKPATGLDVMICQEFNAFSGCKGPEYTVQTEENGTYTFHNVEPGVYALSIRVFASEEWIYVTDGIFTAADYTVTAGKTLVIEPRSIHKLDINPLKPAMDAKVKSGEHTFQWQPYEDADYYEIYLTPDEGDAIYVNERANEAAIKAQLPALNCDYRWSLAAFKANGVKIAETNDYWEFSVIGEDASCYLAIEGPKDGVTVEAKDIVLDWTPHPDAASYKILMWDDDDANKTKTLDFYQVDVSEFYFNGELTPEHRYVWSVYAYNANGDEIAASEIQDFTVK